MKESITKVYNYSSLSPISNIQPFLSSSVARCGQCLSLSCSLSLVVLTKLFSAVMFSVNQGRCCHVHWVICGGGLFALCLAFTEHSKRYLELDFYVTLLSEGRPQTWGGNHHSVQYAQNVSLFVGFYGQLVVK